MIDDIALTLGRIGLVQQRFVKVAAGLCLCTYVAAILTILLHCNPVSKMWQIYPNPGSKLTEQR